MSGVLTVISGVIGVTVGLAWLAFVTYVMTGATTEPAVWQYAYSWLFLGFPGILPLILGIIAVVGGMRSLRKRRWGWAMTGAVCACLIPPFVLGIIAVILLLQAETEFKGRAPVPPASPQAASS